MTIEHYVDIARHYLGKDYKVYLLGMASESKTAHFIKEKLNNDNLIDMTGKTNLKQLMEILSLSERLFTPDTGTMHLAALCKTPITAIFYGPAYPHETLAYTQDIEVYMPDRAVLPCYPCKDDEFCCNNYQCHKFNFKVALENGVNEGYVKLSVGYDNIGQLLSPINDMALLWRDFASYYFFGKHIEREQGFYDKIKPIIKRELQLWEVIDVDDLGATEANLEILKPLGYYCRFVGGAGVLVKKAIEYMRGK
jgi:hypothetical protein